MSDSDREQRNFINNAPSHLTYSELSALCTEQFGARAWSPARIRHYWLSIVRPRVRHRSTLHDDSELRAFVEDRLGRWKLDDIVTACRERFGAARAPSRSALHRHWQRMRAELKNAPK